MSSIPKKTKQWLKQALITEEQAEAILAYEKTGRTAWDFAGGILLLAAISAGLGLIALVAANWSAIPPYAKLTALFLILAGTAWWALRQKNKDSPFIFEALLILFMILCMAGIGLTAQIYNIKGESREALLFWAFMSAGLALLSQKSLAPHLWLAGIYMALAAYAVDFLSAPLLMKAVLIQPLVFFIAFLLCRRGAKSPLFPGKIEALGEWAFVTAGFSLLALHSSPHDIGLSFEDGLGGILLLAGLLLLRLDSLYSLLQKKLLAGLLSLFALFYVLAVSLPLNTLILLLFSLLILGLGAGFFAARKNRSLFGLCLALLALRLTLFYFEVFKSLSLTGFVLIGTSLTAVFIFYRIKKHNEKHNEMEKPDKSQAP